MAKGDKWRQFTKWFNTHIGQPVGNWFKAKTGTELSNAEKQANAFNAEEAQKARDWEEAQYLKYESPKAMMDQYQQAGLNPALMYEGYSPSPPSTDVAASSVSPHSETPIMSDMLQTVLGVMSMKQTIDKTRAEVSLLGQQKDLMKRQAEGQEIENKNKQRMYDLQFELGSQNIKESQQRIRESEQKINESLQNIKESASRISLNEKQIQIGDSTIELQGTQADLNRAKETLTNLDAQKAAILLPYVEAVQKANLALAEAQTEEAWQQANKALTEAEGNLLQNAAQQKLIDGGYYEEMMLKQRRERKAITANATVGNICNVISSVAKLVDAVTPS
jgi:hypothetical protein